jgi:tRNA modification GTPase
MIPDPLDTIVALSSPPGPGARAVVRATGPGAFRLLDALGPDCAAIDRRRRASHDVNLLLAGLHAPLPAAIYVWPAPRTYTGQDLLEFHTISAPPLVDLLVTNLLVAGARAAQAGEFTLRSFLAGKLTLTQAEAVLAVIHAGDSAELAQALEQLAGGLGVPLLALRGELLDSLADLEAGLDFAEEDLEFVASAELARRFQLAHAEMAKVRAGLEQRAVPERPFRAVLVGRPNVGKSSLFNRLLNDKAALVSSQAGTTRDYLVGRLQVGDVEIDIVDTAGWDEDREDIQRQAQALARAQAESADLVLLCLEEGEVTSESEGTLPERLASLQVVIVATKCDAGYPHSDCLATSAISGAGVETLRCFMAECARKRRSQGLAPSLSRCRHHLDACLSHLEQALVLLNSKSGPEFIAVELRAAIDEIGEMVGAVYTDDLLDRVFSRFCIGK